MVRSVAAFVACLVLVGACSGAAQTAPSSLSPTTAATAAGTPATTATPFPSASPAATGTPEPTTIAACDPGPLTPAKFLASDPTCYVTKAVSIIGWWQSPRSTPWLHGPNLDHEVRGSLPLANSQTEDVVLVDEQAAVAPGGWPGGAHWATVTGTRSPTTDRACHEDYSSDGAELIRHCPSYLVATKVVESEPPASALAGCAAMYLGPGGGWVAVDEFTRYPPACFGSRNVTVHGWFDIRYLIAGWEDSWGIAPGWLWLPIGPWTVVAPGSNPETAEALNVYFDPARRVDASRTNRWVLLTGHYADAKAQTCHVEYAGGYDAARDGPRIPDSFARRTCEVHFVVTSIRDANP